MAIDLSKYKLSNNLDKYKLQPKEEPRQETFMEKVAGFAGVKNISKAIAYAVSPEVRQYEKETIGAKPTAKQIAGDVLQVGATIGTAGMGAGASILKTAVKVGAAGAVAGFGSGLSSDKSIQDSAKQAVVSGIASAATYGAVAGAGKLIKSALSKTPESLMTDALKVNKRIIESGKNPAQLLVDEKQFGGMNPFKKLGQLWADTENASLNLNQAISEEVSNLKGKVATTDLLREAVTNVKAKSGNLYSNAQFKKALLSAPIEVLRNSDEISWKTLNEVRQELGAKIGEYGFKKETPSLVQDITREIWKSVRNKMTSESPTVDKYISKLELYGKASKLISSAGATAEKSGLLTWADIIAGGVGGAAGGAPGAVVTYALKRLAQNPNVKITAAQALSLLNQGIEKIPTDSAGKISKTALVNLLKGE